MGWYRNNYQCDACRESWTDEWSCACNDRCPRCRFEIEPYDSVDLSILVDKIPGEDDWIVYVSSDDAEHDPAYAETRFSTEAQARTYAEELAGGDLDESAADCARTSQS